MKHRAKSVVLGLLISVVLLYLAFRKVDFGELVQTLQQVSLAFVLAAVVVDVARLFLPALRWRLLLLHVAEIEVDTLWHAVAIGFAVNNVLPLRAGEFARAYVLGKSEKLSKTAVFGTIIVERMFDGISLLALALVSVLTFPLPTVLKHYLFIAGIVLLAIAISVIVVAFSTERTHRLAELLARWLPARLASHVRYKVPALLEGFQCLRRPVVLVKVVGWSLLMWFMEGSVFFLVAQSLHLPFNYFGALLCAVITNLGISIPSSPGFVGPFEFFSMSCAVQLGATHAQGASYALLLHAVIFLPITLIGLYYLNLMHLKLSALTSSSEAETDTPPANDGLKSED